MGQHDGLVALCEGLLAALHTLDGAQARQTRLLAQVDTSWPLEAALQENAAEAAGALAEARTLAENVRDVIRLAAGGGELHEAVAARRRLRLVRRAKAPQGDQTG